LVEPEGTSERRASEKERGREATNPLEIPWTGWKDIGWRLYQQANEDRLLSIAGGVVFYGLLALFPGIAVVLWFYMLFFAPTAITDHISNLEPLVPRNIFEIVRSQMDRIASQSSGKLSLPFIFSLLFAIWSAMSGVKAIIDALNIVYEQKEARTIIRYNLIALAFTVGAIGLLLLGLGAVVVLPILLSLFRLEGWAGTIASVLRWPVLLLVLPLGLAILYRYGPHRTRARWEWVWVGSLFAVLAWVGVSYLLSWYISNFANYQVIYGSLGAAVALMMWLWFTVVVVLVGAELNAEIEHQTARDTTIGPEKPLGKRGAVMADTVGKALDRD
jgi:membrane protein